MVHIAVMPKDPQLPQLEVVANRDAMRDILQGALPGFAEGRLRIDYMKLLQLRYETGERCRVCYALRVTDEENGEQGRQIIYGEVESNGRATRKYRKALKNVRVDPKFGPAVHFLSDLNMILWGFPNDPQIRHLPRVLDSQTLSGLFAKFEHATGYEAQLGHQVNTELVKYVPQDRCTLRHEIDMGSSNVFVIYSKTFSEGSKAEMIFQIMHKLAIAPVSTDKDILIPEPLFLDTSVHTLFVRGLNGMNVDDDLSEVDLNSVAAAAGRALAGIHQCQIDGLEAQPDEYIRTKLVRAEALLGKFDSSYQQRVEAINDVLWDRHASLTEIKATPIHGAFRLSQLLLVDDRLALMDFDQFLIGNPIYDVGNFVAHLMYLPLRKKISQEQSLAAIQHFCQSYAKSAPWGLPVDVLHWQTAAHLISKHAKKCVKQAKKRYDLLVDDLLTRAEDILEERFSFL